MQNLKFSIRGDYWDVQLYMGRLYLWTMNGTIQIYNWEKIIDHLVQKVNNFNRQFFYHAFVNNRELGKYYSGQLESSLLTEFNLSSEEISFCLISEIPNLYGELPIYTEIYGRKIYAALQKGLHVINIDPNENTIVENHSSKLWDNPLINIRFSNEGRVSLSAAENGLFELDLYSKNIDYKGNKKVDKNIYQLSNKHSLFANYISSSLYNVSNLDQSQFIYFEEEKIGKAVFNQNYEDWVETLYTRIRDSKKLIFKSNIVDGGIINEQGGIGWGSYNKLVKIKNNDIWIYEYNQADERPRNEFLKQIKKISLYEWKGKVIGGSINPYGIIIEAENALVIVFDSSNNEFSTFTIPGPITKWRDLPRSLNYKYLLNLVFEDYVSFYSFPYSAMNKEISQSIFSLK